MSDHTNGDDLCERDKWLKSLQEFGRPNDAGADYAAHIQATQVMREVLLSSGRERRMLILSNDNNSSYSADIFQLPSSE